MPWANTFGIKVNSEYRKYHSSERMKKERAARNRARRLLKRKHGARAMKGKEVDHKDGNPNNNSPSNLRVISRHHNRVKQ